MSPTRAAIGTLLLIFVLEGFLFGPNFRMFFCGDSLYFLSRIVQDWYDARDRFCVLDGLGQYRPLTFLFYSLVVNPLAGLNLRLLHIFPFLFHSLNVLLVFALSRTVLDRVWGALLAAFFFGISTTGAYITYDNTFLPDYLYAFFYLSALLVLCPAASHRDRLSALIATILLLCSVFSKEAGVTFPASAFLFLLLAADRPERPLPFRRIITLCLPLALIAAGFISLHLVLKEGKLYPAGIGQPHQLVFTLSSLQAKAQHFLQALGLPLVVGKNEPGWLQPAHWLLVPVLLWMLICTLRGLWRRRPVYLLGILWIAVTVAPALLIAENTWEQNLYVPLCGLAWIFAQSITEAEESLEKILRRARLAWGLLLCVPLVIIWVTGRNAVMVRRASWMAGGSHITKNCLEDLQKAHPRIPPNSLIYVETAGENVAWHFDSGRLAATFYGDPSIRMRFSQDGLPAPSRAMLDSGKVYVMSYRDGRLYDRTPTVLTPAVPRQPQGVVFTPNRIKKGESVTIEVLGGEGMELDCRYVIDSRGPVRTVYGWITADDRGRQTLPVNVPGHYVISAIRNSLRSDWVPVHYEWDCLKR